MKLAQMTINRQKESNLETNMLSKLLGKEIFADEVLLKYNFAFLSARVFCK